MSSSNNNCVKKTTIENNVIPFPFEEFEVRITDQNGEPWFVLADVCRVLKHSNPTVAASRLDDDEKMTLNITEGRAGKRGGAQKLIIINEPGLYSLILTSNVPAAKRFRKWVTSEVLPSIRKTGRYDLRPQTPAEALRAAANEAEQREIAELTRRLKALNDRSTSASTEELSNLLTLFSQGKLASSAMPTTGGGQTVSTLKPMKK